MGLKSFLMKRMVKSQVKNLPPEQQELVMTMVEKDPQLFQNIAAEIQAEIKQGKDQLTASMKVMQKYKPQIQKLSGKRQ